MTRLNSEESYTLWQEWAESPSEPAIVVEVFDDIVSLQSDNGYVNLNYHHIDELCKLLKRIKKEKKK